MPKRRMSKASKRRLTVFGSMSIFIIVYFFISLLYSGYSIYTLSKEKNKLEKTYVDLQEKAEDLKIDIDKLSDPEYLADYARENYLYSKDGEYILQIDYIIETKEEIDSIYSEMNKKYILLGLFFLLFLMFLYVLIKAKKRDL